MTPQEWQTISELFHSAAALAPPEREIYLDEKCPRGTKLRDEVESLLRAHEAAADFISAPAANVNVFTSHFEDPPTLSGTDLGHYRIERSIGKGGMGEVYLATDTKLHRRVALKKLPDLYSGDAAFLRRFQNEARAAATLNHPNVATIYSVEDFDGRPLIAMEYVEGTTLDDEIPDGGMNLRTFLDLFSQVADALAHAHRNGVTHRDIKPGNVMINAEGVPKILDFGLAQITAGKRKELTGTAITQPGQILGTPSYMSPEQARGDDMDGRSDIFSFGVVMYEALTGRRPFTGSSHAEVVSKLLNHDPVSVSRIRPEVPKPIAKLIAQCLKKNPRDRPRNMETVRDALLDAKTALSVGLSTGNSLRRFYREAQTASPLWIAAGAVVVLVIAFAGWYLFSGSVERPPFTFENMTIRRLSQSQNVVFAHVTADGRSVAFNSIEANETRALWIRRIDDRNALQLVPPQSVHYWGGLTTNDDGSQLFYITAGRAARHGTLYRISTLGGQPRKLVETVNDLGSLSPDGKRLLIVRYGDQQTQIISLNAADGSDERVERSDETSVIFRDPQYSVDGRSIFFIRMDRVDGVEYWSLVERGESGETIHIPRQKERMSEIAVLRTGDLLLNAVDRVSQLPQLFHFAVKSGKLTRITNDLNSYFGISVDRRAETIVAAQRYDENRIWAGEVADTASLKPVTNEANVHTTVEWTPDGRLVFDAVDNTLPHIWIANSDGSDPQQLTPNETGDSIPRVSPDGRFIVFTSDRSGEEKIWRMNIDGSDQVMLTNIEGRADAPRFAPDGQAVYFNWFKDKSRVLGSVPITGGNVTEHKPFSEGRWALSPDGQQLAYAFWDAAGKRSKVAVKPVGSPTNSFVFDISPTGILEFSSDGKSLIYKETEAGDQPYATVWVRDIESGAITRLLSVEPDAVLDIAFSRDRKKVAVIRGKLITDAVMLTKVTQQR